MGITTNPVSVTAPLQAQISGYTPWQVNASGAAVEAVVIGPLGGAAGTYVLDVRERPIQITANKSLTIDASGAGTVCVYAEGYTRAS